MKIKKEEVIKQLCLLCTKIGEDVFDSCIPHDCFCGDNKNFEFDFQFAEEIITFLEKSVDERIEKFKEHKNAISTMRGL